MTSHPPAIITKLKAAESRQRANTIKRGLKAEFVSVEGLLLLQRGKCQCGCGEPLDLESAWDSATPPPGYPVIAHVFARGSGGGHLVGNVWLWRHACNAREAPSETRAIAKGKRMAVQINRPKPSPAKARAAMPGSKASRYKRKLNGTVEVRT
jgi:hypothetical protein